MNRDKIIEKNTIKLKNMLTELKNNDIDPDVKKNLTSYLSNALRITQYYGNLRIKYLGFNYTMIGFYTSFIAFFISLSTGINLWLSISGTPIIIGLIIYFRKFVSLHSESFDTISFKQSDLQHYSCIMDKTEYPELKKTQLDKFLKLVKKSDENNQIDNDIKALILQYLYQANYNNVGLELRDCLLLGMKCFVYTIMLSVVLFVIESVFLVYFL